VVIEYSRQNNIQKILIPSIDLMTVQDSIDLSEKYQGLAYPAAGIHPNYAGFVHPEEFVILDSYLNTYQFVAVGEIGLDFFRDYCPRDQQIKTFVNMLDLACKFNLPVCLHNRLAEQEMIQILENWINNLRHKRSKIVENPGVFHAYEGSELIAEWALKNNFYFGIGGLITYRKSEKLLETLKKISLDRIILETDSPFLAPWPFRGKTNQPGYVVNIVEKIAEIKDVSYECVVEKTCANSNRLFSWEELK
jgi:TatD DNase family protein